MPSPSQLALAVSLLIARSALAQTAPAAMGDSTLNAVEAQVARKPVARVLTMWGPFDLEQPRLTATAVDYDRIVSDVSYLPDSVHVPRPMPMTWVEAIKVPRHQPLRWGLISMVSMVAIGWVIGTADKQTVDIRCPECRHTGLTPRSGMLVFGSAGLVIGTVEGLVHRDWISVYQAR